MNKPERDDGTIVSSSVVAEGGGVVVVESVVAAVVVVVVEAVVVVVAVVCGIEFEGVEAVVEVEELEELDDDDDDDDCKFAGMPFLNSGNSEQNFTSLALNRIDAAASCFFSSTDVGGSMPPYMISSLNINDMRPTKIVLTDQVGFHVSG